MEYYTTIEKEQNIKIHSFLQCNTIQQYNGILYNNNKEQIIKICNMNESEKPLCWVKEDRHKSLYKAWYCLYDILGKTKL